MKHILIVGANSLVGKHVSELVDGNEEIQVHRVVKGQGLSCLKQKEFDLVLFLAQSPDYKQGMLTADMIAVNISLLQRTLEWCRGNAKTFINFSTGSVYQTTSDGHYSVDSKLNHDSNNPYVVSKLSGEMVLHTFHNDFEKIINVRPFFIYGEGQKPDFLIPRMIRQLKAGNAITLNGGEGLVFNPLPAWDCARMLVDPLTQNEAYDNWDENINLSGEDQTSLGEMLGHLVQSKELNSELLIGNQNEANHFINDEVVLKLGDARTQWKDLVERIYDAQE